MRKIPFALALLVCLTSGEPSSATEPGTPMDCSDLELAPGLTCTEVRPPLDELGFVGMDDSDVDNDGRVLSRSYSRKHLDAEIVGTCGLVTLRRTALVAAFDATGSKTPLVTVTDRCVDPADSYFEIAQDISLAFDAVRGALFVELFSFCARDSVGPGCPYEDPAPGRNSDGAVWVARIDGFTPLSEVLPPPPLPKPLCDNGLDDDGDGRIDADDAHCKSAADNDESRP